MSAVGDGVGRGREHRSDHAQAPIGIASNYNHAGSTGRDPRAIPVALEFLENSSKFLKIVTFGFNSMKQLKFPSLHIFAHSDKQIQRRGFFLTHLTSMIICYEGIYGLSDASHIQ